MGIKDIVKKIMKNNKRLEIITDSEVFVDYRDNVINIKSIKKRDTK